MTRIYIVWLRISFDLWVGSIANDMLAFFVPNCFPHPTKAVSHHVTLLLTSSAFKACLRRELLDGLGPPPYTDKLSAWYWSGRSPRIAVNPGPAALHNTPLVRRMTVVDAKRASQSRPGNSVCG